MCHKTQPTNNKIKWLPCDKYMLLRENGDLVENSGKVVSSSCRAASTDIPDTLSLHVSLSFIAPGRSSGLYPVSSHSCCMYVRAGRPAFDWPYAGVHRSTSLTILSLLLQQCPACLVRLACIDFIIMILLFSDLLTLLCLNIALKGESIVLRTS